MTGRRTQARPPIGADLPVPVVYAFIRSTDPRDCSVVPDEAGGARKAVEHLLALGRRRIAAHHRAGAPPLRAGSVGGGGRRPSPRPG